MKHPICTCAVDPEITCKKHPDRPIKQRRLLQKIEQQSSAMVRKGAYARISVPHTDRKKRDKRGYEKYKKRTP